MADARAPGTALIVGYDRDPRALALARANVARAGLGDLIQLERRELAALAPPAPAAPGSPTATGLLVTNPPYGERLHGTEAEIVALFATLGERLRLGFPGWRAAIVLADRSLGHLLGLRASKLNTLYNGALKVTLAQFEVPGQGSELDIAPAKMTAPGAAHARAAADLGDFVNRLRKNERRFGRMARRQGVTCYRLYDADLPNYAFAIDLYGAHAHVQEYAPPPEIEAARAQARLRAALRVLPEVLGIPPADVHLKVRQRQRGVTQYTRRSFEQRFVEVSEGDLRFLVNLTDFLDTGLFLSGRLVRRLIEQEATGQRFLNLFAYTAAATVAAGRGGAASTTSVDLSKTYLDWAKRNLKLNGIATNGRRHRLLQANVLEWVAGPQDGSADAPGLYDLIYLDPPTFSNSKRMGQATFSVTRDHADLIRVVARRLLAPGGSILFAANARRFALEADALTRAGLVLRDLSRATLPLDFARSAHSHHVWRIARA